MTLAVALLTTLAFATPPHAPPFAPQIGALAPCGGQRGTEVVVTVTGQRLHSPEGLLFTHSGIDVVAVVGDKPESCRLTLRIQKECPLGAHPLRLRTKFGLSNLVVFWVGALQEIQAETKGQAPQVIPLECTVNGRIAAEEAQRFAVSVLEGTAVHCEAVGSRLGFGPLDLRLTVLGPDGTAVASADDTALGMKDPLVGFTAKHTGVYTLELASAFPDAANTGAYRLHVGTFPRPTGALPCGGQPGEELEIELLGDQAGLARTKVRLPADGQEIWRWFPSDARGFAPTPIFLRVGGPPNQTPVEDAKGRACLGFPSSVHGVVPQPEASVRYWFLGKRGQDVEFRVLARTLRSPLDPVLIVRGADNRFLVSNDDSGGLDSLLRFSPPADGEYQVEVRDLLRRGSKEHFFRLETGTRSAGPSLRMVVNQREEAVVTVPKGGHGGVVLQLANFDFDAGLALIAQNLPAGVSASFGPIRRGNNLVPLVLEASADALLAGAQMGFLLRAEKAPTSRPCGYAQDVPLVYVRNNQPLLSTVLRELPVAVTEAMPFQLDVQVPKVPIVRGGPLALKVKLTRAAGFTDPVRVRALWNPPGVSAGLITLDGKTDSAVFPIDANSNATLGTFPFAIVASTTQRGGNGDLCSAFFDLRIEKPWIGAELGKARAELGEATELVVKLKPQPEITSPYKAVLIGLPRGVTAPAQDLAANAESVRFPLTIANEAQPGRHTNFQLELRVPSQGEEVVHRFGGGEIRVDKPLSQETKR